MTTATRDEQAQQLAEEASRHLINDEVEKAAKKLREAISIAPENATVKATFAKVQEQLNKTPIVRLCERFVNSRDEVAGKEAIQYVANQELSREDAETCIQILLTSNHHFEVTDRLLGELLGHRGAKCFLASQLEHEPTATFRRIRDYGDMTLDGAIKALLDPTVWTSGAKQAQAQRDSFQLLMAQLMRAGQDDSERVMRAIARLLATNASTFKDLVDSDSFNLILSSLDTRLPAGLRSQATLATAKLLEIAPEIGQDAFIKFVTSRVASQTTDDLIVAFSAAAAVFPIVTAIASSLFLTPGFVEQLVPIMKRRSHSTRLERSALELLNAACMDKYCRDAIKKHCIGWLQDIVDTGSDAERAGLAAVILVKTGRTAGEHDPVSNEEKFSSDLVAMFEKMMLKPEQSARQSALEGLAYTSLQPTVKETLANNPTFLKNLIATLDSSTSGGPLMLGGIVIFAHLTNYLPTLSEEQMKMSQLKAYANSSKPQEADALDDNAHVTARCKKVLDAGVVPLLVKCSKTASPTLLSQILTILLNLSYTQKHRPLMAQQGAVKLLIAAYDSLSSSSEPSSQQSRHTAAHALARILISVNPSHVFTSSVPITSAIRPLISLLTQDSPTDFLDSNTPRSLLPTFEAILALTNLASTPAATAREQIISNNFGLIDDLLLSSSTPIQRAATELICNLCASPSCIALLTPSSSTAALPTNPSTSKTDKDAKRRLHILLALCDAEDLATRKAAGGAMAMISEFDVGVQGILDRERGVQVLVSMCRDESEDVRLRGVVCLRNLVCTPDALGQRARKAVTAEGGTDVLKELLKKDSNREILETGIEALKVLV